MQVEIRKMSAIYRVGGRGAGLSIMISPPLLNCFPGHDQGRQCCYVPRLPACSSFAKAWESWMIQLQNACAESDTGWPFGSAR